MKIKHLGTLLAACICSASLMTGCSFSDVTDKAQDLMDDHADTTQEETQDTEDQAALIYDESVEAPVFTGTLGGTVQITMGSVYGITCPAESENGTITYQWYTNNVDSNGGGTPIEGGTTDVIAVDSSAPGYKYYYVVATNEIDGRINRAASDTLEVIVWDIGTWQEDENGIVRYMMIDGTYPTSTWFMIDENFCYVKEDGNRSTGLVEIDGLTYYFSDEGYLQRNVTGPNGEIVDENGVAHPAETQSQEQTSDQGTEAAGQSQEQSTEQSAE
ncbi:MAG: hypothetical protein Q4B03_00355 [Lachnospiraceae bacterium]|nr:hypothetical protein [Lachnospiraceae bacterium]